MANPNAQPRGAARTMMRALAGLVGWEGGLTDGAFWQGLAGSSSITGKPVTVDAALQISTAYRCVKLLSESVATLPLGLYERKADGSRVSATAHPLYKLLLRPNQEMTLFRFLAYLVTCLQLWGNAYVEKVRVAGRVVALIPLAPQRVTVIRRDGRLFYSIVVGTKTRELSAKDVMHVRNFGVDGSIGLSPVAVARNTLAVAAAAEEATGKVFSQGMQLAGFLVQDGNQMPFSKTQRQSLQSSVTKFASSTNANRVMVLEAGLKYQAVTMNPEDAQLLATRAFHVEDICRWYGVPPYKVGHMDKQSSWASSVDGQNLAFLQDCLAPLLANLEQEFSDDLLGIGTPWYFEFNVEGLLRADSAGRASFYTAGLQNGWINRKTVAKKENLPDPGPGGEHYTVQANMIRLDQLGQGADDNARMQAALRSWLGMDEPARQRETA